MQQRPSYSSAFTIESIMAPQPRIPAPVLYGGYMFLPPVTDHATAHALTASSSSHHGVTSAAAVAAAASLDPRTAAAVMGHASFMGRPNPSSHHLLGVTGLAAAVAASSCGVSPVVSSSGGTVTGQSLTLAQMSNTNTGNGPTISLSTGTASLAPPTSSPSLQNSESHHHHTSNSNNHHYHSHLHHNRTSLTPTPPSSSSSPKITSTNHSSSSSPSSLPNSPLPSSTVSSIVPLTLTSASTNHLSSAVITTVTAASPRILSRLGEYRVHHQPLNSLHHQPHGLYQQSSQQAEHDEQSRTPLSDYRHHSPDKGKTQIHKTFYYFIFCITSVASRIGRFP